MQSCLSIGAWLFEEADQPLLVANLNDCKIDAEMFLFVVDGRLVESSDEGKENLAKPNSVSLILMVS